ncbi:MAG: phosphopyruvate hydratase [Patescibacteria group bacterium]|nr:MAG: phosphopyruvate hydratase [Patescibacteria group bacterium]
MPTIREITGREILDSRGNPTVEAKITLSDGTVAKASVPSGASTGVHEAHELRDGDKRRYGGLGVLKAVKNIDGPIADALRGMEVQEQRKIDARMCDLDGTPNKSKLGANAILGVSLAAARAGATSLQLPLYRYLRDVFDLPREDGYKMPLPMMNVLNGGAHADWSIDFQECIIIPKQKKFRERVRCGSEIFHALRGILKAKKFSVGVGDEGGFAPKLKKNAQAFELIALAVRKARYKLGTDVGFGMDPATSEFYDAKKKKYILATDGRKLDADGMVKMWASYVKKWPFVSIEDGMAEDDWSGWKQLTDALGKKIALVGDDFFVTNADRLRMGIERGAANAILIKVNQIGTLSETIDAIRLAQRSDYKVAVSHRSGETADTMIADLAVAVNAEFIKTGSLSRSERLEKYNRLMEIEDEVGA